MYLSLLIIELCNWMRELPFWIRELFKTIRELSIQIESSLI